MQSTGFDRKCLHVTNVKLKDVHKKFHSQE